MNSLRVFILGSVFTLFCCTVTESVWAQDRFNLFDRKPKKSEQKVKRTVNTDLERRIIQAIQSAGDPEKTNNSQAVWYYGLFFAGLAAVVAGLVYWRLRQQQWAERELNNPMSLVQELYAAHHLSEQEKQLMQELAERYELPSSLKLFVDPAFLLKSLDNESFASSLPTVRLLLSKLFGMTVDDDPKTAVSANRADSDTSLFPVSGSRV